MNRIGVGAVCAVAAALTAGAGQVQAESPETTRLDKLEKENTQLRTRLDALEDAGYIGPNSGEEDTTWNFLMDSKISGFITASYFYDTSDPGDDVSNGYLWNDNFNEFTLNKIKLTLENPAQASAEEWDAGYHVSAIFGADSRFVNTAGGLAGMDDIRQAFLELNVPVGKGVNVRAGQLISLLNYESGDGGSANPNFSQGNQWFFTGNGPSVGVQASTPLSEKVTFTARVQNGLYAGAVDGNDAKTMMANLAYSLPKDAWLKVTGHAGPENLGGGWLTGGQILAGKKLGGQYNLNVATELTYMSWERASVADPGERANIWSAGVWLFGDLTEKVGFAFRGEVVSDEAGAFTSGLLGFPQNSGQDIYTGTATLNYWPLPNVKIQPEVRFDATTLDGGYDGTDSRWTVGLGASYIF